MARSTTPAIDRAEEMVHAWIDELGDILDWSNDARTYLLFRTVLHAIRDFLTVDEAADLAAQLPVLVRGIYYEGWDPSGTPEKPRSKEAFLNRITNAFQRDRLDNPEVAIAGVIKLLNRHVSAGEMAQVRQSMRKGLHFLFPDV